MALFFPGQTTCALCDGVLTERDYLVGTSHFIAEGDHPLWRFSDAVMHRACFLVWERRKTFVARFNAMAREQLVADDFSHPHMTSDGHLERRWAWPPGLGGDA